MREGSITREHLATEAGNRGTRRAACSHYDPTQCRHWGGEQRLYGSVPISEQNVEIVRRCYELLNRREFTRELELYDPEIEVDNSRLVFNPDVYRGHAGIERWMRMVEETWDDFRLVPKEFVDAGDNVVAAVVLHGKGKRSGVEVKGQLFAVWTLRDSKVLRIAGGYRDRSDALAAAGFREQTA